MEYHTGRLIITVIFLIFLVTALANGYVFSAIFWAVLTWIVAAPFFRGGKFDLYYDTPGRQPVVVVAAAAPPPMPEATVAPAEPGIAPIGPAIVPA